MTTRIKYGYPMVVRDATPMLDAMIHDLTNNGNGFTLARTSFRFGQMDVRVKPAEDDRDVVFEAAINAFRAGGWGFSSTMANPDDDPARPVIEMAFRHPIMNTRVGEPAPPRPQRVGFEMNLPDASASLTPELVDYYADYASKITRSILEEMAAKERVFRVTPLHDALDDDQG